MPIHTHVKTKTMICMNKEIKMVGRLILNFLLATGSSVTLYTAQKSRCREPTS